jgi:hypothetical protein
MNKWIFVFLIGATSAFGQGYVQNSVQATYEGTFDPKAAPNEVLSFLYPTGAPIPGGEGYKSFLAGQKLLQNYRNFPASTETKKTTSVSDPVAGFGTSIYRLTPQGNPFDFTGGIPNDNAMAISKDGILCAAVNSVFWAMDTKTGELIMPSPVGLFSLQQMANGSSFSNYYDPKLIYDPTLDRFVLVFLKDNDAANSRIIVCFSSTNDPTDPWNIYSLTGNPLSNNRWTDFPAIALSETGLVITANLIIPNVSWQVGFDGSVIWHLNKTEGFVGGNVDATVYTQIAHNGKFVRNLHPVRGHDNISKQLQFLSNRNFDLQNDTIFLVTITEGAADTTVTAQALVSNLPYGVPPNGKQGDTDTTDATKGLQTNDGRVLGAIQKDDWIQFVSTTAHGTNANAAIYHGFIHDAQGAAPKVSARVFSHPVRDYGYPNITWSGVHPNQIQCLIGFNFTSIQGHPGMGAVQLGNDTSFSNAIDLINGTTHVDRHSDSYERWGDYFAIQPMFDEDGAIIPSESWMAGFYGDGPQQNRTYISQVFSTDTVVPLYANGGQLYPNPAYDLDIVTITFNLEQDQRIEARLYNTAGALVQELAGRDLPAGPAELYLHLGTLAAGNYVVRLEGSTGFVKTEQLLKL